MSLLTRAVGSARLSSSSAKRIVISNTRLCQARKRTENDRFSHDGACYIVSFCCCFSSLYDNNLFLVTFINFPAF